MGSQGSWWDVVLLIIKNIKNSVYLIVSLSLKCDKSKTANISRLITILKWFTLYRTLTFNLTNPCLPSQYTKFSNVLIIVTKQC